MATVMSTLPAEKDRIIVPGPAGFMPPSACQLGVSLPKNGVGIAYGHHVPEDLVLGRARQKDAHHAECHHLPRSDGAVGME